MKINHKGGVHSAIQHGSMGISTLYSFSLGTFISIMEQVEDGVDFCERQLNFTKNSFG